MSQDPQSKPSSQQNQGQKQQRSKKSAEKTGKDVQHFSLKAVDRVLKWPVVDIAWNEGNHVYGKIKGESFFVVSCVTFVLFYFYF